LLIIGVRNRGLSGSEQRGVRRLTWYNGIDTTYYVRILYIYAAHIITYIPIYPTLIHNRGTWTRKRDHGQAFELRLRNEGGQL